MCGALGVDENCDNSREIAQVLMGPGVSIEIAR
jgi:hypothetical protein